MLDINIYLNQIFTRTGEATLHIVIMISYYRKLKVDTIPNSFLKKIDELMQNFDKQFNNNFNTIQEKINTKIKNLNFSSYSLNQLENDILNNKVKEIIDNKPFDSIFSTVWTKESGFIKNTLINPELIKTNINSKLSSILPNIGSLFDTFSNALKAKLQNVIGLLDGQSQIYLKMLDNVEKIQNFTFKTFNLSQIIIDNLNKFQQIYENQINTLVNDFIGLLDPLNKYIDNFIDDFENSIENLQIGPIIQKKVLEPIEGVRAKILGACQDMLDSLTEKIMNITDDILGENNDSSNSPRLLETIDIGQLEDIVNFFHNMVANSVNFVRTLPLISDVINTYNTFKFIFDGSLIKIIKGLANNLIIFTKSADEKIIDYLRQSITNKITKINTFVQQQLSSVNNLISLCINVIHSFSFDSLKKDLLAIIYKERDKLINFILSKLAKFSFDYGDGFGHTIDYAIVIPIGPVPLTFEFAFDWNVFYKIGAGISGFNIFAYLKIGASSDVTASAGVGLPFLQVMGYIRGVIAKAEGDFTLNFALINLNAYLKLCFSVSFGDVTVGVATKAYIPINKLVCWVQSVVLSICHHIPFIGSLCDQIFKWINVCKWVSEMGWSLWIDFFPPIKIVSPLVIQRCPWQKQLG